MTVQPEDLRFDYKPFETPLRSRQRVSDGSYVEFVKRGQMRAMWDSPRGLFSLAWAADEDLTEQYESEPSLQQAAAKMVEDAYARA